MINVGIYDGDVIIVRKTPYAQNGEIVVALVDVYKRQAYLCPHHPQP